MKYPEVGVVSSMLAPITAATTERTANLDCAGANFATILVHLGAEVNTNSVNVAMTLSESDDTVVTNFATFIASFNRTVDNTAGVVATSHIDLDGRKRYLRLTVTPDTTTNGAVLGPAIGILYKGVRSATLADYGSNVVIG